MYIQAKGDHYSAQNAFWFAYLVKNCEKLNFTHAGRVNVMKEMTESFIPGLACCQQAW